MLVVAVQKLLDCCLPVDHVAKEGVTLSQVRDRQGR